MPSATLKIFLVHGDAKRLRTAELSNWTGKAAAAPRSELDDLLARDEALNSGVYFLTGSDPETGKNAVYIGEAESIRERIKGHLDKDYWNHVIFFISKDENLTKAHVRYLEGRLIEQARQAGRALVKNGQGSGARLPESDREDMEIFLKKVHQLLPALGADFLLPHVSQSVEQMGRQALYCEIKGHRAMGAVSSNGFVVFKGSRASPELRPSAHKYPWVVNSRQRLLDEGAIASQGNVLVFVEDTEFPSPSSAAAVIFGGTANGLTAWKDASGRTLKEIEAR